MNRAGKNCEDRRGRWAALGSAALSIAFAATSAHAARMLPADPGTTFQAHVIHGGFVVDEMQGGHPTVAYAPGFLHMPGDPVFVLADGTAKGEGIWIDGPGAATARKGRTMDAPLVGRVVPSWKDDAIRLTIEPIGHRALHTGPFVRDDQTAGPSTLTRDAALSTDVEGGYRAEVQYPDGSHAGWLGVRIGEHQRSPEIYEAVLPASVDEGLATASAAALDQEVDWIQDNTFGVHRGTLRRP